MSYSADPIQTAAPVHAAHEDPEGARFGMWLFLYSEMLLFGAMFVAYSWYSLQYRKQFLKESLELSQTIGAVNTTILLTSSLTMVLSIGAIRRAKKRLSIIFLSITLFFALLFLVNKGFEWGHKFEHGIYPGSPSLAKGEQGVNVFYAMYYAMTGMHGLHVVVGMVLLSIMLSKLIRNKITQQKYLPLEISGLYWHLVDLIWIFLFPLFYLIR